MNSSTVWNELNNCNVYNATKLLIIAELLTTTTTTTSPTTETDCQLSNILSFLNNKNKSILYDYNNNISRSVHKQLVSIKFLKETIVQDIYLLLQSDWEHIYDTTSSTTATTTIATTTSTTTTVNSTNEIINKAKTLTSLSFINMYHNNNATTVGIQGLLRIYLDTAEGFIVNLLETELNHDNINTHTGKKYMYFIIVCMLYICTILFITVLFFSLFYSFIILLFLYNILFFYKISLLVLTIILLLVVVVLIAVVVVV